MSTRREEEYLSDAAEKREQRAADRATDEAEALDLRLMAARRRAEADDA